MFNNGNNSNNLALKYPGWRSVGNSDISWTGEALFILGRQSPRDGVLIKILMVVQPKNR